MSTVSSIEDRRGLVGRLEAGEVVRLSSAVESHVLAAAAAGDPCWTVYEADGVSCSTAPIDDPDLTAALAEALSGVGTLSGLQLIRHGENDHGLPTGPGVGFLLDLADMRLAHGGLVMVGDEPMRGWRAEAGALTLFDGAHPPLLTVVTPGAPAPRLAIVGWAA